MRGRNRGLVPGRPAPAHQRPAGPVAGQQRHAEEDHDRAGDVEHRHVQRGGAPAEPARHHGQEEVAEQRIGEDLEDRIERDQDGGELARAAGERVPDQHHRDAPGEPDDDEPVAVRRQVGQEPPGQREHHDRAHDPVRGRARCRSADDRPTWAPIVSYRTLASTGYIIQRRPRPDRDRDAGHLHAVQQRAEPGEEPPEEEAQPHGGEDPERQVAVEGREALETRSRAAPRRAAGGGDLRARALSSAWWPARTPP